MKTLVLSLLFIFLSHAFVSPVFADAGIQGFVPLSPTLPVIGDLSGEISLPDLINALFTIAIVLSAILAVIMVAIGGFQYMTTDSVFSMGNAKERISDALIGLLIVLTAILLLQTINPELVKLKILAPGDYGGNAIPK